MQHDLGEIEVPRYEALWVSGPVGAFRSDSEGNWIAVNARWEEITGVTEEEALLNSDWLRTTIHPDDRAEMGERWIKLKETGDLADLSFRFYHPKRGLRHAVGSAIALRDDDGKIVEFLGTLVDETERIDAESALSASEEMHRLTIANLPGSAVGLYDRDMRCLLMEGIEAKGMTSESCRGKHISELTPPEAMKDLLPGVDAALAGREYKGEFAVKETGEVWTFHAAPFRADDGEVTGFMIVAQDVTEQREAERKRLQTETMFRIAFDRAPIGMAIIGPDERFHRVNAALEAMLGMTEGILRSGPVLKIVHPGDMAAAQHAFARVVETGEAGAELRLVGADDRVIWVDARATLVVDDDGKPLHVLAQLQDVTERHELIGRLEHLVVHDPLTGLTNRRGLGTALAAQIALNERYGERGCLMIVDLDNFKGVNDTLGHAVGDQLIIAAASALRTRLRESDVVARLGGDEFAVILPEQDVGAAQSVAADLIHEISVHAAGLDADLDAVTASIGLTTLCCAGMTPGEALMRADHAMYDAKRAGKGRVSLYDETTPTTTAMPTGSSTSSDVPASS